MKVGRHLSDVVYGDANIKNEIDIETRIDSPSRNVFFILYSCVMKNYHL